MKNDLLREYSPNSPPTPDDFARAWNEDAQKNRGASAGDRCRETAVVETSSSTPARPKHRVGAIWPPRQGGIELGGSLAVGVFWRWRRVLGKPSLLSAAAARLQGDCESLLIVVSAPYRPLVSQWIDEITAFGVEPLPSKGSARERTDRLDLAVRGLLSKVSKVQVAVVTENYLTSPEFRAVLDAIPEQVKTLLIADEVHNLGSIGFISNPPERFDYRLGLSATPERQYDPDGTRALFDFFGDKVFEFSLAEAIGVCLVPYNYYLHRVSLTEDEFEEWQRLTVLLLRAGFGGGDQDPADSGKLPSNVTALLNKRRKVIESAENKVLTLRSLLGAKPRDEIRHTLVYTTDKGRDQLRATNGMLQNDLRLDYSPIDR